MTPEQREAIVRAAGEYGDASYDEGAGTVERAAFAGVGAWKAFLAAVDAVEVK